MCYLQSRATLTLNFNSKRNVQKPYIKVYGPDGPQKLNGIAGKILVSKAGHDCSTWQTFVGSMWTLQKKLRFFSL